MWEGEEHDEVAHGALAQLAKRAGELAREKGSLVRYLSASFAAGTQSVLESYGAESIGRLRAAVEKYDPERVFQTLQNDGFLLRNVLT